MQKQKIGGTIRDLSQKTFHPNHGWSIRTRILDKNFKRTRPREPRARAGGAGSDLTCSAEETSEGEQAE